MTLVTLVHTLASKLQMTSSSSSLAPISDLGVEGTRLMLDLVRSKLKYLNSYTDDILPEYVIVLLGNKHGKIKIKEDLEAFLDASLVDNFTDWLFDQYEYLVKTGKPMPVHSVVEKRINGNNKIFNDAIRDANSSTRLLKKQPFPSHQQTNYDSTGDVQMGNAITMRSRSKSPHSHPDNDSINSTLHYSNFNRHYSRRNSNSNSNLNSNSREMQEERGRRKKKFEDKEKGESISSMGMESIKENKNENKNKIFVIGDYQVTDARQYLARKKSFDPTEEGFSFKNGNGMGRMETEEETNSMGGERIGREMFFSHQNENGNTSMMMMDKKENMNSNGIAVRCQYFPNCKSGDNCPFVHPKDPCKYFPNCSFGGQCLYVHPALPCKFQDRCQNPSCNYQHASPATLMHRPRPMKNPYLPPSTILCRFHPKCLNTNCPFVHPSDAPCKYGEKCQKPGCNFLHPVNHNKTLIKTKVMAPCRFGTKCANSHCPYQHYDNGGNLNIANNSIDSMNSMSVDSSLMMLNTPIPSIQSTIVTNSTDIINPQIENANIAA